jgi:hypothetical protein
MLEREAYVKGLQMGRIWVSMICYVYEIIGYYL